MDSRTKIFLCFLFLTGCVWPLAAQRPTEDVLYLKNGWILRGHLTTPDSAANVGIQTNDGNVFRFAQSDVREAKREAVLRHLNIRYRSRGFGNYTEVGALASRTNVDDRGTTTSAFTFHTVNGYRFGQLLYAGVGVGVDLYASQTFIPVFASLRGDFSRRGILIPYYYVDGGWGLNGTSSQPDQRQRGGVHFAIGGGLKVLFNGNAGFLLSAGYYLQQTAIETVGAAGTARRSLDYNRVAIRAGFSF